MEDDLTVVQGIFSYFFKVIGVLNANEYSSLSKFFSQENYKGRNPLFLHLILASFFMTFSSIEYFIFNFKDQIEICVEEEDDVIARAQSKLVSNYISVKEPLLKKRTMPGQTSEVIGQLSKQDSVVGRSGAGSMS